ncbi:MAG: hypothetical protein FWE92_05890 [Defluviitaleaceae bacterium]|nr:hypothetical protein [Defluviitaleaceae bacterium]
MDIKEYLLQCGLLSKDCEHLKQRVTELRELKDGIHAFFVKEIVAKRIDDKLSATIAEIDTLEDIYVQKIVELLRLKYDYHILIDQIPDRRLRLILELKYIDLLSWEEVADKMYYSVRNCHNLHALALAQAQNIREQNKVA